MTVLRSVDRRREFVGRGKRKLVFCCWDRGGAHCRFLGSFGSINGIQGLILIHDERQRLLLSCRCEAGDLVYMKNETLT